MYFWLQGRIQFETIGVGVAESFFQLIPGRVANQRAASIAVVDSDSLRKDQSRSQYTVSLSKSLIREKYS